MPAEGGTAEGSASVVADDEAADEPSSHSELVWQENGQEVTWTQCRSIHEDSDVVEGGNDDMAVFLHVFEGEPDQLTVSFTPGSRLGDDPHSTFNVDSVEYTPEVGAAGRVELGVGGRYSLVFDLKCATGSGPATATHDDSAWDDRNSIEVVPPAGARISTGTFHTCAISHDGSMVCWGGTDAIAVVPPPDGTFTMVSSSTYHSCALRDDQTVVCWGREGYAAVPEGRFLDVAAGYAFSCGLRDTGRIECWGDHAPDDPPESDDFVQVTAGYRHACGLRERGEVVCWGQLVQGQPNEAFSEVRTSGEHTCALREDGTLACWGNDGDGQVTVPDGRFIGFDTSLNVTCGIREGGAAECWGALNQRQQPTQSSFVEITTSCGFHPDGTVSCWGDEFTPGSLSPPADFVG